ncbi:hypothetical protein [Roseomonas marmotae]|uniref:Uncharacterized protein n=1 Tax=Roseomonas marmotae TaxID=2768161 RepID=A0ABS3KB90_9PROT|nr:hypothetical protein [Roseomonas marmotae]MBO1074715.1 hypothetical protein [Roseomonas marmotae]QTI77820.1 hypothetical protein IAI58_08630 [Roseomonas marmotae]
MTKRLFLLSALVALPVLAGCNQPGTNTGMWDGYIGQQPYLAGAGDPLRAAALEAPFTFGDLNAQRGQPARVALSLAQLEYLTWRLENDPGRASNFPGTTLLQLQAGRAEARRAFGIAPNAPAPQVMDALQRAARELQRGNTAAAQAALSGPDFPLGGAETLRRLSNPPSPLLQVQAAAGAINNNVMDDSGFQQPSGAPFIR